jgi:hypothetical protein
VTANRTTKSPWIGRTEQELVSEKGSPINSEFDGSGGRVLTYGAASRVVDHSVEPSVEPVRRAEVVQHRYCVNKDGVIYAVR